MLVLFDNLEKQHRRGRREPQSTQREMKEIYFSFPIIMNKLIPTIAMMAPSRAPMAKCNWFFLRGRRGSSTIWMVGVSWMRAVLLISRFLTISA